MMQFTGAVPAPIRCDKCGTLHQGVHYCPGHQPTFGFGAFTPTPLTEERVREIVREIVREEIKRAADGVSVEGKEADRG